MLAILLWSLVGIWSVYNLVPYVYTQGNNAVLACKCPDYPCHQSKVLAHLSHKRFCLRVVYTRAHTPLLVPQQWSNHSWPHQDFCWDGINISRWRRYFRKTTVQKLITSFIIIGEKRDSPTFHRMKFKCGIVLLKWLEKSLETILLMASLHISRQLYYVTWKTDKAHSGDIKLFESSLAEG